MSAVKTKIPISPTCSLFSSLYIQMLYGHPVSQASSTSSACCWNSSTTCIYMYLWCHNMHSGKKYSLCVIIELSGKIHKDSVWPLSSTGVMQNSPWWWSYEPFVFLVAAIAAWKTQLISYTVPPLGARQLQLPLVLCLAVTSAMMGLLRPVGSRWHHVLGEPFVYMSWWTV